MALSHVLPGKQEPACNVMGNLHRRREKQNAACNYTTIRGDSHFPTSSLRLIPLEEVTVTCIVTAAFYTDAGGDSHF